MSELTPKDCVELFKNAIRNYQILEDADKANEWLQNLSNEEFSNLFPNLVRSESNSVKIDENDIVYRLYKRADIRRSISTRKSVQEGKPDRIADLLEEAAREIEYLRCVYDKA